MSKKPLEKKQKKRLVQVSSDTSVHTEVLEDISCDFDMEQYKFSKKQTPKNSKNKQLSEARINPIQQHEKQLIKQTPPKHKATTSPIRQQVMEEKEKKAKQTPIQPPKQQAKLTSFFNASGQEKNKSNSQQNIKQSTDKIIQNISEQSEIPIEVIEQQEKILSQIKEKLIVKKRLDLLQPIKKQNFENLYNNEQEVEEQRQILAQIQQSKKSTERERDILSINKSVPSFEDKIEKSQPYLISDIQKQNPVKKGFKNIFNQDQQLKTDIVQSKQPLKGQKIVITGLFNTIQREKLKQKIQELGADCPGNVSGVTTLLIAGEKLEDGRPAEQGNKYRQATERGVKIIRETDLNVWFEENVGLFIDEIFGESELTKLYQRSYEIWLKKHQPAITQSENKILSWTDHYQPRNLKELMGNRSAVDQLREWLVNWGKKIDGPKEKKNFFMMMQLGRFQITGDKYSKACMISGTPGIGKSSAVHLIAEALGFIVLETNASEQRNKKSVRDQISHLVGNKLLFQNKVSSKFIIVMDEVDGMTGSDRGGIQELIDAIKHTQVPIICICNDNENQKLKTLITYCYHIRFIKPSIQNVFDRLEYICKDQKILMSSEQLKGVASIFDCDIRQAINFLQLMRNNINKLGFLDNTKRKDQKPQESFQKDQVSIMNQFEAAQQLLNRQLREKLNFRKQLDMFFLDYDLMPLIIQDSYLNAFKKKQSKKKDSKKKQPKKETKKRNKNDFVTDEDGQKKDGNKQDDDKIIYSIDDISKLARASELIAQGDIVNRKIRYQQQWSLMPSYGLLSTIMPCELVGEEIPFPKFPEFWGKNSTKRRINKELQLVKTALAPVTYNCFQFYIKFQGSARTVRFEYGPIIFRTMKKMLQGNFHHNDQEASWAVVELLEHFNLTPDDFKTNLMDIQFNPSKKDNLLIDINAPTKTTLTKLYNKRHQIYQLQGKKPKGRKTTEDEKFNIHQYNPVIGEEAPTIDEVEKLNLELYEEQIQMESAQLNKTIKKVKGLESEKEQVEGIKLIIKKQKQTQKNHPKIQTKKVQKKREESDDEEESSLSGFIVEDSDDLY